MHFFGNKLGIFCFVAAENTFYYCTCNINDWDCPFCTETWISSFFQWLAWDLMRECLRCSPRALFSGFLGPRTSLNVVLTVGHRTWDKIYRTLNNSLFFSYIMRKHSTLMDRKIITAKKYIFDKYFCWFNATQNVSRVSITW